MLNKIILGTANFIKPYGIFSEGEPIFQSQINSILIKALKHGISTLDTAIAYGDISSVIPDNLASSFKIITKISFLDKKEDVLRNLHALKSMHNIDGILIHDPKNVNLVDKHRIYDWLAYLKQDEGISKIGVSVYDMNDLEQFHVISTPDIIQIPLNPFNQCFNNDGFKNFVKEYEIEVHARSLFLQGILLSDTLPKSLEPIKPFWLNFQETIKRYPSRLHALLQWASNFDWISNWVLGVSSVENFQEIVDAALINKAYSKIEFQSVNHPMVDPRNWKNVYA